ncbi:MAG: GtrA family protein [Oscillospiraceae bacterium]|nr:GtrA family protein [Oscillospiraceae bacterium]
MMEKLRALIAAHKDVISYLFFGVLTTLVNFLVFFPLFNLLHLDELWCNVIAWVAAVAFAFFTNRRWVFHSEKRGVGPVLREAAAFTAGRLFSFGVETGLLALGTKALALNPNPVKVVVTVLTVILNYVLSRWLVFRKK